jgi:hypothetical protein
MQEIAPDGIPIPLDLTQLRVGRWVFITCLNVAEAKTQLRLLAANQRVEIRCRDAIFKGYLGIRVWRTK